MWIGVISLFPEMFEIITHYGIVRKAIKNNLLNIHFWNPRKFTQNRHHKVDDRPYGGGPGMLMMIQPLFHAICDAKKKAGAGVKIIYFSPQGQKLTHNNITQLLKTSKMILVCGRYEGIDQRFIDTEIDEEWSIGDYVLSGGELAAMVFIDVLVRFIPGSLSNPSSAQKDSFIEGLLDCPHYTRPSIFNGLKVPTILLSGNHVQIDRWRLKQSLGYTWLKRPEFLENITLNYEQMILLHEFQKEYFSNI